MTAPAMNLHQLQEALLDLVGPPGWRNMGVTHAKLELAANKLPQLTLELAVPPARGIGGNPEKLVKLFELRPIDAPADAAPLDLDRMAARARSKVGWEVGALADHHQRQLRRAFAAARAAADERHLEAVRFCKLAGATTREAFASLIDGMEAITAGFNSLAEAMDRHPSFSSPRRERWWQLWGPTGTWALAIVLTLGALGPALDDAESSIEQQQAEQDPQLTGAVAQWEAEARGLCRNAEGGAYIRVDGGGIICADKPGRAQGGAL